MFVVLTGREMVSQLTHNMLISLVPLQDINKFFLLGVLKIMHLLNDTRLT